MDMGYFHIFTLVNKATLNIGVQITEFILSFLLGIYLGVELLDLMGVLCLTF